MNRRRALRRARALPLLAALLVGSGLLRLGGDTGAAILHRLGPALALASDAPVEAGCVPPPDVATVLAALEDRDTRLVDREARLAEREVALAEAEAEISAQIAALEAAEQALESTLARADTAAEEDVQRLVAVYENMKPAQAAALFSQMTPSFAAGFLARMRPEAAAQVMAGLEPEIAYSVSAVLAGRNATVGAE